MDGRAQDRLMDGRMGGWVESELPCQEYLVQSERR